MAIRCGHPSGAGIRIDCVRLDGVTIGINSIISSKRGLNVANGANAEAAERRLRFDIGGVTTSNADHSMSPTDCLTRVTRGNGLARRTLRGNGSLLTGCGAGSVPTVSADLSPSR